MDAMVCEQCGATLTDDMELEFSARLARYFCNPDCARDFYFSHSGSYPLDIYDRENFLEDHGIIIQDGNLYAAGDGDD